ncbi:ATP-binding protein, partial [Actinotalea ferrariae]|uniref:ATP-binding protein n=1 Tax=Actinotalea ferrariae TaxID=1386098 RepID=UPI001C8BDEC8
PWAVRQCGLAPRLAWALRGDDAPDPGLPQGAAVLEAPDAPANESPRGLVLVHGADAAERVDAARVDLATPCLVTPLPANDEEWHAVLREATVAAAAVVLDLTEAPPRRVAVEAERASHVRWAWCSPKELPVEVLPRGPRHELALGDGVAPPHEWLRLFGAPAPPGTRLSTGQLRQVAATVDGDVERLAEGVRRLAGGHLDELAVRVRPRRGWSDLVLAPDQSRQLHELAARYRRRSTVYEHWQFPAVPSTGVVALFAGPSGTGKTLAAEVLAAELGLDLYKVDLSSVVSKWVGETEKNLERIFDAAQARELVLFFDEADALFGKRSEVSDAHDRYANIEVSYLLQRLETYDGLVVLATNLQRNIDSAFLRRISVAVEFTVPDEEQRRAIWQRAFPASAPVEALDLDFLARQFKVSGGSIRNAALTAAFLAADAGTPITMDGVMLAVDREFTKLGRLRSPAEFAHYYDAVQGRRDGRVTTGSTSADDG